MSQRLLRLLLACNGVMCLLALPAALMPVSWMAAIHERLGLGAFPRGPIIVYLARSVSMFYAGLGALFLLACTDVQRYVTVIKGAAWFLLAGSAVVLGAGLAEGLPTWWVAVEAPLTATDAVLMLLLLGRSAARTGPR